MPFHDWRKKGLGLKILDTHLRNGIDDDEAGFEFLFAGFQENFRNWDFYVDWEKARENRDELEIDLNLLNSLLGKDDPHAALGDLLTRFPHVIRAIPILFAMRAENSGLMRMIMNPGQFPPSIKDFDLKSAPGSAEEVNQVLEFAKKSGMLSIFEDGSVRNLVDYVFGVEVGMDTNTRKNRSGKTMEDVVETKLISLQKEFDFEYLPQATKAKVRKEWGRENIDGLNVKKFDFAVLYRDVTTLIEVNYYAAGGSKLSPVVGNFVGMKDEIYRRGMNFIWVTDGLGWGTEITTLKRGFHELDHVFNLRLLELGALEEAIGFV